MISHSNNQLFVVFKLLRLKLSIQTIDDDTGAIYTVNGVSSEEKFETPWVYGKYSLQESGLSFDNTELVGQKLIDYTIGKFGKKYDAITIISTSITSPKLNVYDFKVRLGDVGGNTYLYASVEPAENGSVTVNIRDDT